MARRHHEKVWDAFLNGLGFGAGTVTFIVLVTAVAYAAGYRVNSQNPIIQQI